MRKVIGIGETLLDIIFKNNQPQRAVPGGSTFNCMISLGRCEIPAIFISELGKDRVGRLLQNFILENNLSDDYIDFFEDGNTPVSLAFLDENQQAEYQFFRAFPKKRLQIAFPEINENDILILSSYFAVNPVLREKVYQLIQYAKRQKAVIYYDINFRKAHAWERNSLMPFFMENFDNASIVRCSDEDLENLFAGEDIKTVYRKYISPKCNNFIVTQGEGEIRLITGKITKNYKVNPVTPVSTIGAGDNFNAGIIYGIIKNGLSDPNSFTEKQWDELIAEGQAFAKDVCLSFENYISQEFAMQKKTITFGQNFN